MKRPTRSRAKELGRNAVATVVKAGRDAMDAGLRSASSRTIRVAVTGLSRAGKTVFTTNLAHSLMLAP